MRKRVRVVITPDDIRNGVRTASNACPFALALRRVFPKNIVSVLPSSAMVVGSVTLDSSRRITKVIHEYDIGLGMQPGTFYYTVR